MHESTENAAKFEFSGVFRGFVQALHDLGATLCGECVVELLSADHLRINFRNPFGLEFDTRHDVFSEIKDVGF